VEVGQPHGPGLGVLGRVVEGLVVFGGAEGLDASADPAGVRFQDGDVVSGVLEQPAGDETGDAGADDEDLLARVSGGAEAARVYQGVQIAEFEVGAVRPDEEEFAGEPEAGLPAGTGGRVVPR
jgi:hypothetical protein